MCLILLAWRAHPDYPLVIAANRDEYFDRPTAPAQFWPDAPQVIAGRDLQAGGTWLGITRTGRFAALTNFREPEPHPASSTAAHAPPPTRGELVSAFLMGQQSPETYLAELASCASNYRAFNLLCGTLEGELYYYSNRTVYEDSPSGLSGHHTPFSLITPGIHGLSNHLLDTPWPKVARGKNRLEQALSALPDEMPLFQMLGDETPAPDQDLPQTGVSLEWERALSSACIRAPHYGTRSSTVLMFKGRNGIVSFDERTLQPSQPQHQQFQFSLTK